MPRLSVLMPARNAAGTIGSAVASTLAALPGDAELVVLDDDSSDATASILFRFDDERLRVHYSDRRLGVSRALSRLLRLTDSQFVARMDADDRTLPGRFTAELAAVKRHDVVFSTVIERRGGLSLRLPAPSAISHAEFPFRLLLGNPVAHSTMLARRSAIELAGGYHDVPAEDYELWLRLAARRARIRRIGRPTVAYRRHPNQLTADSAWQRASWLDPSTDAAYLDLSSVLLGGAQPRLTGLAATAGDDLDFERELERFELAFGRAIGRLLPREQRSLAVRLQRRLAQLRQIRDRVPA